MIKSSSSERLAAAMAGARRHWQAQRKAEGTPPAPSAPACPAWTIALSRQAGARGSEVAQALGERLEWPVYDRELVQRIAGEMGLRVHLLESVDEQRVGWLRECLQAFTSTAGVSASAYVHQLAETMLALAAHGECVLVGRGAALFLPAATTLRVRLVAPRAERIAVVRQRLGIPYEQAALWVDTTDRERDRFVQDHFHKDPSDPCRYDLVLNSARFSVAECAEFILTALDHLRARTPATPLQP
jgi:cytidylate kinase